jgi:outer membrane protein OmpA-like peptidoglycan-associated protein
MRTLTNLFLISAASLAIAAPVFGQDPSDKSQSSTQAATKTAHVSGQKQKIKGIIVSHDADRFTLRDMSGVETAVVVNSSTKLEEKKDNPFRSAKKYSANQLVRGLNLEVEGRGDGTSLVADKIKIDADDLVVAMTVETRVTPVEGRVSQTETRITQAEQNAQRLSGQLDELNAVANAANGGAKHAQETADQAIAGVTKTNERISSLVVGLDDYEATKSVTVNFKVASAVLSPEAKQALDEIAGQAKNEKGFVIEVDGFASSEGKADYNRELSQRRSDAVVRYLAEDHMIPLRRIIMPFGYGAAQPVADNTTREGRQQNRRVEVKFLSNKGLNSTASTTSASSVATSQPAAQQ